MAELVSVQRNNQNEYRIQIRAAGYSFSAVIDTGMTSPVCLIGLGLNSQNYRAVAPYLDVPRRIEVEGAGAAGPRRTRAGLAIVSIDGLDNSDVETYVAEVGDNLLGVCYFHALAECEVVWGLEGGETTIRKKLR